MKTFKHKIQHHLIHTAEAVFAEKGFEGASVRDIAARADTNAALIYYHFESKEELYKSIFEYRLGNLAETLQHTVVQPEWGSYEKLHTYVMVYVNNIRENFYFHRMLNSEILSFRNQFFKRTILKSISTNSAIFRTILQEGIDRKEFKPVDQDLFLMTLFYLLHQVIGKSPLASELLNVEEISEEQMTARILHYIRHQLCLPSQAIALS